jgi:hypothetical protein
VRPRTTDGWLQTILLLFAVAFPALSASCGSMSERDVPSAGESRATATADADRARPTDEGGELPPGHDGLEKGDAELRSSPTLPDPAPGCGHVVGRFTGTTDSDLLRFVAVQVETKRRSGRVECDGSFRVLDVPAGAYEIEYGAMDQTWNGEKSAASTEAAPLVGSHARTPTRLTRTLPVAVSAGAATAVALPLDLPRIEGRVTRAGRPVAGAHVFALAAPESLRSISYSYSLGYPGLSPRALTDESGCFRIYVATPGAFNVRAFDATGTYLTNEVGVALDSPTAVSRAELALGHATVAGSLDLPPGTYGATLWLLPEDLAQADLEEIEFTCAIAANFPGFRGATRESNSKTWDSRLLAEDPSFEFEGLTPGRWILHAGVLFADGEHATILRAVDVASDTDLVRVEPLELDSVDVQLEIDRTGLELALGRVPYPHVLLIRERLGDRFTHRVRAWLRQASETTVATHADLVPGREYEAVLARYPEYQPPCTPLDGSKGRARFRVLADGRTEPTILRIER